jgi:hypothetical protein
MQEYISVNECQKAVELAKEYTVIEQLAIVAIVIGVLVFAFAAAKLITSILEDKQ